MATVSASATPWWRNHFIWRKIHSLFGVVPIGLFLLFHFFENSFAWKGAKAYDAQVAWITGLPILPILEVGLLGALLFHAVYGTVIMRSGQGNVAHYDYGRNWFYSLQRFTAWIAVFFIGYHVVTMRFMGEHAGHAKMAAQLENPLVLLFYLVGVLAVVLHFATGLVNFCFKWGITVGPRAQRNASYLFGAFGVGFAGLWLLILLAFVAHNHPGLLNVFK